MRGYVYNGFSGMDPSLVRALQVAPDETTASVKETKERGEATTSIRTKDFVYIIFINGRPMTASIDLI